jgi:hypothetical protein
MIVGPLRQLDNGRQGPPDSLVCHWIVWYAKRPKARNGQLGWLRKQIADYAVSGVHPTV